MSPNFLSPWVDKLRKLYLLLDWKAGATPTSSIAIFSMDNQLPLIEMAMLNSYMGLPESGVDDLSSVNAFTNWCIIFRLVHILGGYEYNKNQIGIEGSISNALPQFRGSIKATPNSKSIWLYMHRFVISTIDSVVARFPGMLGVIAWDRNIHLYSIFFIPYPSLVVNYQHSCLLGLAQDVTVIPG